MGMLLAAVHVIGILISGRILNIPVRDVMIPELDFHHFSEFNDSDSNSNSRKN